MTHVSCAYTTQGPVAGPNIGTSQAFDPIELCFDAGGSPRQLAMRIALVQFVFACLI